MKPRFSVRALLIAVFCLGFLCWWHDRPRRVARKLQEAVVEGRYEAADSMIAAPGHRVLDRLTKTGRNSIESKGIIQTPSQWLRGECGVMLEVSDSQRVFLTMHAVADAHGVSHLDTSFIDASGKPTPMKNSGPDTASNAPPPSKRISAAPAE